MQELLSFYAFIFGLMVGSFLNVVILRLPLQKDLVFTRSGCTSCGNQLKWFHNIPLVSFLFLKGKCAYCTQKISWRYPLIEMLTGVVSFWLFPSSVDAVSFGYYLYFFAIACIFIVHFFIDLDHHLLLDSLNLYLLLLILPYSALTFEWKYWVLGGSIGFGATLGVTWLFYKLRGQVGLGGGDIKLFGILGLILGPIGIIFTIFMSCMVGAVVGIILILTKKISKDNPFAFGPAILVVAAFQIYFPDLARKLQLMLF